MPEITPQNVVLALAALFLATAFVGLMPSTFNLLRRRRLVTQLARLKVEEDAARTLFSPVLTTPRRHDETQDEDEGVVSAALPLEVREPTQLYPAQEIRLVDLSPAPEPQADELAAASADDTEAVSEIDAELESAVDDASSLDTAAETPPEDAGAEDDLLSLFRETRVASSTPAALSEAFEQVSAQDLVAQARELRDLLRRSA